MVPVNPDQEGRAKGGGFDRHPHHDDVIGGHHQQHGEQEQAEQTVIQAQLVIVELAGFQVVAGVADRIQPDQEAHHADDQQEDGAQRVHVQPYTPG